jgi:hypothetical protein
MADSVRELLLFEEEFDDTKRTSFLRKLQRFFEESNDDTKTIRNWSALEKFALKTKFPSNHIWRVNFSPEQRFRDWRRAIAKMNGDLTKVRCNNNGELARVLFQIRAKLAQRADARGGDSHSIPRARGRVILARNSDDSNQTAASDCTAVPAATNIASEPATNIASEPATGIASEPATGIASEPATGTAPFDTQRVAI